MQCHWHVLYDPPERNVLKILKIASKKILLSDGKTYDLCCPETKEQ